MTSTKKLKDIASGEQNCKIVGRLIRLWDSRNIRSKSADSLISIDGIVIDENGEMVQITVPKKLEKQFRSLLAKGQGSLHVFTDLDAIDIKQRTYIYRHQTYMLQFQPTSKLNHLQSQKYNIARYAFDLCPFDQLSSKDVPSKPLLDLIGAISHIGPHDYASATSTTKLRRIKIQNQEEQTQEIQLWGKNGEEFDEAAILEKSKQGMVVAIFAGLTAGNFRGTTQVSSSSATQVFIDLDIPDIAKFCESYKGEAPSLQRHAPKLIQLSPIEAAGKIYKVNQISGLQSCSFQGGATYSCIGKISAIIPDIKWYYKVCRTCKVAYGSISDEPRCDCPSPQPMPMYKLPIRITDDTVSIDVIAFSLIAEDLVERSAYLASQNMKIEATEHVIALQKAIGKTRLFHIGMSTNNSSSFSIKYVLRKCFEVHSSTANSSQATPARATEPHPPQSTTSESSKAKRCIDFNEDKECNEDKQQNTSETLPKRQRTELSDDKTAQDGETSRQNIFAGASCIPDDAV